MVPHRWVLFKAFRKNAEGLAGFEQRENRGIQEMIAIACQPRGVIRGSVLAAAILAGLALAGCSSHSTTPDPVAPVVFDTAPPAVPTGLSAAAVESRVKISWDPNTTDEDFDGFMLYRIAFGQEWPLLDKPTADTTFLDTSPLTHSCSYAVTAVDRAGNESAWLEIPFQGLPDHPVLEQE